MRQVFLSTPWIHRRAPAEIVSFFNQHGRYLKLPAGSTIFNGGDQGEVALVLSGLGAFSYADFSGKPHIFTLTLADRLMGDVDAVTGEMVNITDYALRDTEVRMLSRETFLSFLHEHPDVQRRYLSGVISDHESDMEGMIANITLSAPERIISLFESILFHVRAKFMGVWIELPFSLTVLEISRIVSVERPTVSSILSSWCRSGLVRKEGRQIFLSPELFANVRDWTNDGATPATHIRHRRARKSSAI